MKYWAVMEFLTPETTDRLGVTSFIEGGEEMIDVVGIRVSVVGHRLDQLFHQGAQRDLSGVCNAFGAPISVIINFYNYLFHGFKLTAKSRRVKVRGRGQVWISALQRASKPMAINRGSGPSRRSIKRFGFRFARDE